MDGLSVFEFLPLKELLSRVEKKLEIKACSMAHLDLADEVGTEGANGGPFVDDCSDGVPILEIAQQKLVRTNKRQIDNQVSRNEV